MKNTHFTIVGLMLLLVLSAACSAPLMEGAGADGAAPAATKTTPVGASDGDDLATPTPDIAISVLTLSEADYSALDLLVTRTCRQLFHAITLTDHGGPSAHAQEQVLTRLSHDLKADFEGQRLYHQRYEGYPHEHQRALLIEISDAYDAWQEAQSRYDYVRQGGGRNIRTKDGRSSIPRSELSAEAGRTSYEYYWLRDEVAEACAPLWED